MNPYINSLNGWGGGFIAYFPTLTLEELDQARAGGVFYALFDRMIKADIKDRDYRIEKREGKKTREITPKKVLRELPREALKEKIAELRKLDIPAPQARELLERRAAQIIEEMRIKRIEELNQQTLALIMTAVMSDE